MNNAQFARDRGDRGTDRPLLPLPSSSPLFPIFIALFGQFIAFPPNLFILSKKCNGSLHHHWPNRSESFAQSAKCANVRLAIGTAMLDILEGFDEEGDPEEEEGQHENAGDQDDQEGDLGRGGDRGIWVIRAKKVIRAKMAKR